jgi:hypothetical protein
VSLVRWMRAQREAGELSKGGSEGVLREETCDASNLGHRNGRPPAGEREQDCEIREDLVKREEDFLLTRTIKEAPL